MRQAVDDELGGPARTTASAHNFLSVKVDQFLLRLAICRCSGGAGASQRATLEHVTSEHPLRRTLLLLPIAGRLGEGAVLARLFARFPC